MGLLTIPSLGLIYYFKNYKTLTVKNFIIANVVSVAVLLFIFKLLAPNILRFFSASEIFFVNSIGLPFNSGSIIAALIINSWNLFWFKIYYSKTIQAFQYGHIVFNFYHYWIFYMVNVTYSCQCKCDH